MNWNLMLEEIKILSIRKRFKIKDFTFYLEG